MSLLVKALEKAAQERDGALQPAAPPGEPAAVGAAGGALPSQELELEPLEASGTGETVRLQGAATASSTTIPPAPEDARPEPQGPVPAPGSAAARQRATTVLRAGLAPAADAEAARRVQPLLVIGGLACAALIVGGLYVYLRVTEPVPSIAKSPPPGLVPPPASTSAAPADTAAAGASQPLATTLLVNREPLAPPVPAGPGKAESGANAAPALPALTAAPAIPAVLPGQTGIAPAAASTAPAGGESPREKIRVSASYTQPQPDAGLAAGFAALQAGRLDQARNLYAEIVGREPRNLQALLGLAATQSQAGLGEEAARLYARALELDPRNAYAQAGLLSIAGRADPLAAETRLKQLIARESLPSLHFTLGNLYADQSRWPEAQQSYFQAHALEPAHPDYAFNLAVSLEHVGQPRLAEGFYRRAIELAQSRGAVGFNVNQARERARQLAAFAP